MIIEIISVGKVREKYIKLGIEEFKKRLQPYCSLRLTEVSDEEAPQHLSDKELTLVKQKEGSRILEKVKLDAHVIALHIESKQHTSEQFAKHLENLAFQGKNNITFIIGGSNGLSDEVLARTNEKLSFSKMTFPHQLMKLILLEQVYRGFRIQKGEPYHK